MISTNNNFLEFNNRLLMVNRLNQLGIDGFEFCKKIQEYDCLMAGSFPLQCLLGEFYDDSDIDIFIKRKTITKKLEDWSSSYHEFEIWLFESYGVKSMPETYAIRDIISSRKTQVTKLGLVNVILVDTENLEKRLISASVKPHLMETDLSIWS